VLSFFVAWMRARRGNRDGAFDALERTLQDGEGFLPSPREFEGLANDRRFGPLRARFEQRLTRKTDGRVAFTLQDRRLLPEGIAYDPMSRRFYVGSITKRAIYRIERDGSLARFSRAEAKLDHVLGLAVDVARRTLYAVSTSALTDAGRASPRNAVVAFDLASGRWQRTFLVPAARQLNDVAVAPDGTLLVTDTAGGGVWLIDPATSIVKTLVPFDAAPGANGIAVHPLGRYAYVAASRRPLRIELSSGALEPLRLPARENAAAIDGLYWHDGALIGIQNVTTPARVVRLVLGADGLSVTSVETLQSHHQRAFDEPTTAALGYDGLYVLARTYVSRFNAKGRIERPESLALPLVLRIPLAGGSRLDVPAS
jgi:sugar lactone lactonase YvrE